MTLLTIVEQSQRLVTLETCDQSDDLTSDFGKNLYFREIFRFLKKFQIFGKYFIFSENWLLTLETPITFLTIENNNINNYIVTFEYRVMVTAFAILAMFSICQHTNTKDIAVLWLPAPSNNVCSALRTELLYVSFTTVQLVWDLVLLSCIISDINSPAADLFLFQVLLPPWKLSGEEKGFEYWGVI